MIKLITLFVILHLAACQDQPKKYLSDNNGIETVQGLKCSKLVGSAPECLACYPCDNDRIKKAKNYTFLSFSDSNCTVDKLCCIKTENLKARSSDDNCGKHNPEGNPRRRRPSLRSVLEREYPWRAWVYSASNKELLCTASYIFFSVNALVTTASCVSGYQPSDLQVMFTKSQENPYYVKNIVLHDNFTTGADENMNDIALLALSEKPDASVRAVCLDKTPAVVGSPCVIVSDSETYIPVTVPPLEKCNKSNVNVEQNLMCSFMIKGDYTPQRSAGLYCLNEQSTKPRYTLEGIYQNYKKSKPVAVYTRVHAYIEWIFTTTSAIKSSQRNVRYGSSKYHF